MTDSHNSNENKRARSSTVVHDGYKNGGSPTASQWGTLASATFCSLRLKGNQHETEEPRCAHLKTGKPVSDQAGTMLLTHLNKSIND